MWLIILWNFFGTSITMCMLDSLQYLDGKQMACVKKMHVFDTTPRVDLFILKQDVLFQWWGFMITVMKIWVHNYGDSS